MAIYIITGITHLFALGLGIALGIQPKREKLVYSTRYKQRLFILRTSDGDTKPFKVEIEGDGWDGWEDCVLDRFNRQDVLPSEVGAFDEARRFMVGRV